MTLIVRLQKRKHKYAIILINKKKSPSSGKIKKTFGFYNPHNKNMTFNITSFIFWISRGAKLTQRIEKLLMHKFNLLKKR